MEQFLKQIWTYLDYIINQLKTKPIFQILQLDAVNFYEKQDEEDEVEKVKFYIAFEGQKHYENPGRFYVSYYFKITWDLIKQAQPENDPNLQAEIAAFEVEAIKDFLKQHNKNQAKIERLQAENQILTSFAVDPDVKEKLLVAIANEKPNENDWDSDY